MTKGRRIKEEGRMTGENQLILETDRDKTIVLLMFKNVHDYIACCIPTYLYKFLLDICNLLGKEPCICMQDRIFLVQLVSIDFSIIGERKKLIQGLLKSLVLYVVHASLELLTFLF